MGFNLYMGSTYTWVYTVMYNKNHYIMPWIGYLHVGGLFDAF